MNKINIFGRLTKDPESFTAPNGIDLCNFSVASNGRGKDKTDFFNCVAFRETAKNILTYCKKGDRINIAGSMEMNNYEKSDGSKATNWKCNVDYVEFVTTKADKEANTSKQEELEVTDNDDLPF